MPSYLDVAFWYAGWNPTRWPTDTEVQAVAANFPVSVWKHQIYTGDSAIMPHIVPAGDVDDIRYVIAGAKSQGMVICLYTSVFYALGEFGLFTADQYLAEVRRIKNQLGASGIYVDGMTFGYDVDNPLDQDANRYIAKELRKIVGLSGTLILHATAKKADLTWLSPDYVVEHNFDLIVIGEDTRLSTDAELRALYQTEQVDPRLAAGQKIAFVASGQQVALANPNVISAYGVVLFADDAYSDGTWANYDAVIAGRT